MRITIGRTYEPIDPATRGGLHARPIRFRRPFHIEFWCGGQRLIDTRANFLEQYQPVLRGNPREIPT